MDPEVLPEFRIHVSELKSERTPADCITRPLELVREAMLSHPGQEGDWGLPAYLTRVFQGNWTQVPSLNDFYSPCGALRVLPGPAHNTLVRFRGMVQDTLDTEYFMGLYEDIDPETGQKLLRTGKYADIVEASDEMNPDTAIAGQRMIINCVAIPGEAHWVRQQSEVKMPTLDQTNSRAKRTRDDEEAAEERKRPQEREGAQQNGSTEGNGSSGENGSSNGSHSGSSGSHGGSHNGPSSEGGNATWGASADGLQCLVKLYDQFENMFRVGDCVEFVGVFSSSPLLADGEDEQEYTSWASSRVMRLHAITCQRLPSGFPLLPEIPTTNAEELESTLGPFRSSLDSVRTSLLHFITACVGGRETLAITLLLHMLSRVSQRTYGKPIGKLTLSLSLPTGEGSNRLVGIISHIYSILLPRAKVMTSNVTTLNAGPWYPIKDYSRNRLTQGSMQLSAGTGLIIDETAMQTGELRDVGVKNVRTLSRVLQDQILQYDLSYHSLDFPVDIPCVVISRGKPILGCDLQLPVTEDNLPEDLPQPSEETLNAWRRYLLLARQLPFALDDSAELVSSSFVAMRKESPEMNATSFHVLLTLARLLAGSYLEQTLTSARWHETVQLWNNLKG